MVSEHLSNTSFCPSSPSTLTSLWPTWSQIKTALGIRSLEQARQRVETEPAQGEAAAEARPEESKHAGGGDDRVARLHPAAQVAGNINEASCEKPASVRCGGKGGRGRDVREQTMLMMGHRTHTTMRAEKQAWQVKRISRIKEQMDSFNRGARVSADDTGQKRWRAHVGRRVGVALARERTSTAALDTAVGRGDEVEDSFEVDLELTRGLREELCIAELVALDLAAQVADTVRRAAEATLEGRDDVEGLGPDRTRLEVRLVLHVLYVGACDGTPGARGAASDQVVSRGRIVARLKVTAVILGQKRA